MNDKSSRWLKRFLTRWLDRLEEVEKASPRVKKEHWYQREFRIPPLLVAACSSLFLFLILGWNEDYTAFEYVSIAYFVLLLTVIFGTYLWREHAPLAKSDDATTLIATLFFLTVALVISFQYLNQYTEMINVYVTPLGMAPLLAALLLDVRLAYVMAAVVSFLFGVLNGFSLEMALVAAVGNITLVAAGSQARNATQVARAGLYAGALQAVTVFFLAPLRDWGYQSMLTEMVRTFGGGILSAGFSLAALPFLENFFSTTSNLRLLELTDVNHPLLRRMSLEAPGTYHHSMLVATLAAEAATSIGANSLLCRAGAYFHDIGKILKAEYFIENQKTYGNPHDQVSPSLSKLIITAHVKEGIALGKSYNLDKRVLEFIPQHHGTSKIEYFYQKALKLEEKEDELDKEEVKEESYRYPGPKPQTREAGVVMLSDSVEAASRTLDDPTHQQYKDLVYKLINKKLFDNQLDETPLTLSDLRKIAESFVSTLISLHHNRIPYPEATPPPAQKKERLKPQS